MADAAELARRMDALERRLRDVEACEAIGRLKACYGQLVDARYDRNGAKDAVSLERLAQQIAELFSADAVWDGGAGLGECRGRDAIAARFRAPTLRFSWHFFVKPHIEVDGDRAHGSWDILAPCTSPDGTPIWMAGVEDDTYVCENGRWLHASMRLRVIFMAPHAKGWSRARPEA